MRIIRIGGLVFNRTDNTDFASSFKVQKNLILTFCDVFWAKSIDEVHSISSFIIRNVGSTRARRVKHSSELIPGSVFDHPVCIICFCLVFVCNDINGFTDNIAGHAENEQVTKIFKFEGTHSANVTAYIVSVVAHYDYK
jgi:succinate dehydrogenase/fumarate reductase-like Fe-S protein